MPRLVYILVLLFVLGLGACKSGQKKSDSKEATEQVKVSDADRVEVLYFHTDRRCITCKSIEKFTEELVEKEFAKELKSGVLVFKKVNISDAKNKGIASRYEVSWSSLFVNNWKDKKESSYNFTNTAFAYAHTAPDTFKKKLKEKIEKELKK